MRVNILNVQDSSKIVITYDAQNNKLITICVCITDFELCKHNIITDLYKLTIHENIILDFNSTSNQICAYFNAIFTKIKENTITNLVPQPNNLVLQPNNPVLQPNNPVPQIPSDIYKITLETPSYVIIPILDSQKLHTQDTNFINSIIYYTNYYIKNKKVTPPDFSNNKYSNYKKIKNFIYNITKVKLTKEEINLFLECYNSYIASN